MFSSYSNYEYKSVLLFFEEKAVPYSGKMWCNSKLKQNNYPVKEKKNKAADRLGVVTQAKHVPGFRLTEQQKRKPLCGK